MASLSHSYSYKEIPELNSEDIHRFWSKVVITEDGCWHWSAGTNNGYGVFSLTTVKGIYKMFLAHRISYTLVNGSIPPGQLVRHRCDVPSCVNPEHLETGTHADNARDMYERGRRPRPTGEANFNCKYSDAQVAAIRRDARQGTPRKVIAARYGASYGYVSNLVHGRSRNRL